MRELFVYYRVRHDAMTSARHAVQLMHEELRRRYSSLAARLLTRHGDARVSTWMETYAMPPAGIDADIERAIADMAARLSPFIDGPRHVEVFEAER